MKICLTTDLHLNRYPMFFNRRLLNRAKKCDALLIMGDITTGLYTEAHLHFLRQFAPKVYFVLGNHDFYTSSFRETELRASGACVLPEGSNLCWLDEADPIEVSSGVWLMGVDGWYDTALGDSFFMDVNFDRMMIKDLLIKRRREDRAEVISARALASADNFTRKMDMIPANAERIIVATHYPPWMGPIRSIMDAFWLPQSVNSALADRIIEESKTRRPRTKIEVFCGHVHNAYEVHAEENVRCTVLDSRTIRILEV